MRFADFVRVEIFVKRRDREHRIFNGSSTVLQDTYFYPKSSMFVHISGSRSSFLELVTASYAQKKSAHNKHNIFLTNESFEIHSNQIYLAT